MKKYILTKETLVGNVVFGYNPAGLLNFYDATPCELNDDQLASVLRNLPREEHSLQALADKTGATLTQVYEDISFEEFWKRYDKKVKRKRAEPIYNRLSDANKLQAIIGVAAYEAYLERTGFRGKADPDNYLRNEYYLVDWKKER